MKTDRLLLGFSVLMALALPTLAQDDAKPTPDSRLQKTVTISATHILLSELLAKVEQQTGVSLKADTESKAWKVRELPVSVEVKDATLEDFQRQLAKLLDLRWARSGAEGGWVYTLWQDKNARGREASALTASAVTQQQKVEKQWTAIGDELAKLAEMTPEEINQAAKDNPFIDFISTNPFGKAYGNLLSSLAPAALPDITSGQPFRAPYDSLSSGQQKAVQTYMNGMTEIQRRMTKKNQGETFSGDWAKTAVVFRPMPQGPGHQIVDKLGLIGFLEVSGAGDAGKFNFPIVEPKSQMASLVAKGFAKVQSGQSVDSVMKDVGTAIDEFLRTSTDREATSGAEGKSPTDQLDPKLLAGVDLKPKTPTDVGAALADLTEKPGINIYAESWKQPGMSIRPDKGTAAEVITRASKSFGMTWDYEPSSARIRADNWAERRAAMVSQESIKYWTDLIDKKGALNLDDLAAMAGEFTREQMMTLMTSEEKIASNAWPLIAPDRRTAILFYASLPTDQAKRLRSAQGLSVNGLSGDVRASLLSVVQARGISADDFFVDGATVRLTETSEAGAKMVFAYPPDKTTEITLLRPAPAPKPAPAKG